MGINTENKIIIDPTRVVKELKKLGYPNPLIDEIPGDLILDILEDLYDLETKINEELNNKEV